MYQKMELRYKAMLAVGKDIPLSERVKNTHFCTAKGNAYELCY